jgi:hypothetical protein
MGLMDKAKQAAMQAKESAQHMAQQGQAKVAQVQQGREEGELYRSLGEAYYAAQRSGGDSAAITTALETLDAHFAAAAAAAAAPPPTDAAPPPTDAAPPPTDAGGLMPPPPPPSPASPPPGNFTLDDV